MFAQAIIAHHWAQAKFGNHMKIINTQEPEKLVRERGILDVHSIFHTIQGEGPFCGQPAVFVRLAGCNLQCPGCDTNYTSNRKKMSHCDIWQEIVRVTGEAKTNLVVITGGEPFRQPEVANFINYLIDMKGYRVQVETNGTMPIPRELNYNCVVVCSPKAAKIHPSVSARADAFKYVMKSGNVNEEDGLPLQALDHRATPFIARPPVHFKGKIYLQPMDEQDDDANKANAQAVVKYAMKHNYIVQLQIHKYLGVE